MAPRWGVLLYLFSCGKKPGTLNSQKTRFSRHKSVSLNSSESSRGKINLLLTSKPMDRGYKEERLANEKAKSNTCAWKSESFVPRGILATVKL